MSEDGSGLIRLENYQVEVHIPGNIPYSINDVTVRAIDSPPPELVLKDDEAIISVGLDISTSNASWDTPVKVTMPHCAVFTEPGAAQIIMYHRPNSKSSLFYNFTLSILPKKLIKVQLKLNQRSREFVFINRYICREEINSKNCYYIRVIYIFSLSDFENMICY